MRDFSMSAEARLVFLCAGPRNNDVEIARIATGPLRWELVTRLAVAARAVPVVARRVREALGGRLPASAADMGRLAMVEEFELRRMDERLDETIAAFEGAGIRTVLLKGAALARSVYESVADRPMLDLDVLVSADETEAARGAALSSGWVWKHDLRYAPFELGAPVERREHPRGRRLDDLPRDMTITRCAISSRATSAPPATARCDGSGRRR